jgi:hypothetical protein
MVQCVVMRRVAKRNRQEVFRHRRLLARRGSEGRQTKTPTEKSDGGLVETPFLTLLVPRRRVCEGYRGRSPDSRIILLANAFPAVGPLVAYPVGFRPRSQWRVREGVAPSSQRLHLYSSNCECAHPGIIWSPRCQVHSPQPASTRGFPGNMVCDAAANRSARIWPCKSHGCRRRTSPSWPDRSPSGAARCGTLTVGRASTQRFTR